MTIKQRIRLCILIEKMHRQDAFSERLGLEDLSRFHGKRIDREEHVTC